MRIPALALALAAATSLTGCFAGPCDPPTVTIHWELSNYLGTPNVSCGSVTTAWVDVYIANLYYRFPCTDYVGTVDVGGLAPGGYTATVEGIDADGTRIWSRDWFQVSVGDCNSNPVYTARPGEGTLALDYLYPATETCNGGYMWYSVIDDLSGQTISAIYSASSDADKTLYACGGAVPPGKTYQIEIAVPFGTMMLDWMNEVQTPLTTPSPVYQTCAPLFIDVTDVGVTPLAVGMTRVSAGCP